MVLGDGPLEGVVPDHVRGHPAERRGAQVEGVALLGGHVPGQHGPLLGGVQAPQVHRGERHLRCGVDQLQRLAVAAQVEGGAQHRVPLDHLGDGPPEAVLVEGSADPQAVDVVVRQSLRVQLHLVDHADLQLGHRVGVGQALGEPLAVLGRQQPEGGCADRHFAAPAAGRRDQFGQRGVAEDVLQGEGDAGRPGLAEDLDAADRVAAQVEEVVVPPHPGQPQHPGPDAGQQLLGARQWRLELVVQHGPFTVGSGQCGAVDLGPRGERQRVQEDEDARHHVLRQPPAQPAAQLGGGRCPLAGHQVADQVRAAGLVLADHHHALQHLLVGPQRGLHLAEFDPVAAHLDHVVDPAEELHVPVHRPAAAVAGAVEPGTGDVRVRGEAVGGHLRVVQVAAGQAGAGDVQFAGRAHRHRLAGAVEHPDLGVDQRIAQRQRPVRERVVGVDAADREGGGLGRAPAVDQPQLRAARQDQRRVPR